MIARLAIALLLLSAASQAGAIERRVALLAGHPFGGEGMMPLRYVGNDIERMREVLEMLGRFDPADLLVSFGEDADELIARFAEAQERIDRYRLAGEKTLFLFYYSGHAQDGELRLGDTRLGLAQVKRLINATGAPLRIALLDSCRSGGITRLKGALKGKPFTLAVQDEAAQTGLVLITASSENEDAQESDEIGGSFFTHYLTSGLRGAADQNDDANVTLSEAYNHAYARTVAATIGTRGGIQHPTYHFDLRGTGDVILTYLGAPPSAIRFPADVTGRFIIFDVDREVIVAELEKTDQKALIVGVRAGNYVIKKRETSHLEMQRVSLRDGDVVVVDPDAMEQVAFADDYAKGPVVTVEQVIHGSIGLRLTGAFGGQVFLSTPVSDAYFPPLGTFELSLDIDNLLRRYLGVRLDVGFGYSGDRPLELVDDFVGTFTYQVQVTQFTAGVSVTGGYPVTTFLTVGGQARVGFITVTRSFIDTQLPTQTFSTITPGFGIEAEFHFTQWLRAGVHARIHYMHFNVDQPMHLAYIDGGLRFTAVIK